MLGAGGFAGLSPDPFRINLAPRLVGTARSRKHCCASSKEHGPPGVNLCGGAGGSAVPQMEAHVAAHAQGCCHISPLVSVPAPRTEPDSFDQSFQRAQKPGKNSFFCASTVSRAASGRVINKAQWKRSCSPLPAMAPQHTARRASRARCGQQPPGTSRVWVSPSSALPVCPPVPADAAGARRGAGWQGSARGLCRAWTPCPVGASPCVASAYPCFGVAGSGGVEVGREGGGAGGVW